MTEVQQMCDEIAVERQSLQAAMADLQADRSSALEILSRSITESELAVEDAVCKRSALSTACSRLAAEVRSLHTCESHCSWIGPGIKCC